MIKSILKVIIPLVSFFAITEAYAQDIRYVYCTAEFDSTRNTPNHLIRRDEKFIVFSPIFKVDLHSESVYASRADLAGEFLSTVYKDAKNGKSHPYLTTDHTGRLEGCTREYTTFESAKKSYDERYLVEKRRIYNLGNGKRCAYIATYKWAPKNLQVVYPTVTSPCSYSALAQICNGEDAPRYK